MTGTRAYRMSHRHDKNAVSRRTMPRRAMPRKRMTHRLPIVPVPVRCSWRGSRPVGVALSQCGRGLELSIKRGQYYYFLSTAACDVTAVDQSAVGLRSLKAFEVSLQ